MRRIAPLTLAGLAVLAVALTGAAGAVPLEPDVDAAPAPPAVSAVAEPDPSPAVAEAAGPDASPAVAEAAEPAAVRFTAAGDYAATGHTRAVLGTIADLAPDLHLALGDLSYGKAGEERAWCDLVTGQVGTQLPFELLSGNHESNGRNGNIDDFTACLPNRLPGLVGTYGREWYVDVPQQHPLVRFVMISPGLTFPDGATRYEPGSPGYAWTEDAIDGARAAGVPWVVVGVHKPCLSVGEYGCDIGEGVHDLLLEKRVDLVLNGHEHLYQRSKQLALGQGCSSVVPGSVDDDCIVDADATLAKGAGTVLATVGTGGVPLRRVHPGDSEAGYFATTSGDASGTYGVLDVRVTATALTARFVRASGGTFTDAFTISADDAPATGTLAADKFARRVVNGFGTAERGGRWQTMSSGADFTVDRGAGRITLLDPGSGGDLSLPAVSSARTDLTVTVRPDRVATGAGLYVASSARRVDGVGDYRAKVRLDPDGAVLLSLTRLQGGVETVVAPAVPVAGLTYRAGDRLRIRTQATGTWPTTLQAKVWRQGPPEPAAWQVSGTDSTRALQVEGSVGVGLHLSSAAENAPVTVSIDDVRAVVP